MKIKLLAIGTKMPGWVEQGVSEYTRRLPSDFKLTVKEIPLAKRGKSVSVEQCLAKEAEAILSLVNPRDYVVALEVGGSTYDTPGLAQRIQQIREQGKDLTLLVVGPDGLSEKCLQKSDASWSLSDLTLPHTLVRILVAEQIYRAWSLLNRHPYHRD